MRLDAIPAGFPNRLRMRERKHLCKLLTALVFGQGPQLIQKVRDILELFSPGGADLSGRLPPRRSMIMLTV
jgi:hypothetical protein